MVFNSSITDKHHSKRDSQLEKQKLYTRPVYQPVWSKVDHVHTGNNSNSISIHQSSHIDGESSYQTQRLTPMDLKMPVTSPNNGSSLNPPTVKEKRQNTQQRLRPRLKLGPTFRNASKDTPTNAASSQISV